MRLKVGLKVIRYFRS